MVGKKGFIRTLEAVLAIILLLTLIYTLTPEPELKFIKPTPVRQAHNAILTEISVNSTFRDCLINEISVEGTINNANGIYLGTTISHACKDEINAYISIYRPTNFVYLAELCSRAQSCLNSPLPVEKSIYAESIMLASDNPKVFRIYFWEV